MSERGDHDKPSGSPDDERSMAQDYDFEDALEMEWREVYGRSARDVEESRRAREAGPVDPAAA